MYAICLGDDINAFIGWNQSTDYYDVAVTNCIVEDEHGDFIEYLDDEEVWLYVEDTIEAAIEDQLDAQREFDEEVHVVDLEQRGSAWYPIRIVR